MDTSKSNVIVETLKGEILSGKYSSNRLFPSERALAVRFKSSRPTVRQAVQTLRDEGLIRSQRGSGTFVTKSAMSRKIGLMLSGITYSEYFQPIATSFMQLAREQSYTLCFEAVRSPNPEERIHEAREIAAEFIHEQVAGVIYHPLDYAFDSGVANREILKAFRRARIPVVLFDSDIEVAPRHSDYDLVSIDNIMAGEMVARHLLESGAENIHFLLKPNWIPNAKNRIRGVMCAVGTAGRHWSPANVLISEPDDVDAIRRHFRRRPRPDAFICENDQLAAIFKKSLEKIGLNVPRDVLLAGFDDVNVARLLTPPLTSIHQPCDQIAAAAFSRLLARIAEPSLPPQEIFVHAPLVVRASTTRTGAQKNIVEKGALK